MYIIVELGDHAKLCYADGSTQTFVNKELAQSQAEIISANNPGIYQVWSLYDTKVDSLHRLCVQHNDRLKLLAVLPPLNQ